MEGAPRFLKGPNCIRYRWPVPNDVVFSPDGRLLACPSDLAAVHLLDFATGIELPPLGNHDVDEVTAADFDRSGTVLASTDLSGAVYLWNPRSATPLGQLPRPVGGHFLAFLADSRTLVTAGQGRVCSLIQAVNLSVVGELTSPRGDILLTAISADRSVLVNFTEDGSLLCWDLRDRSLAAPSPADSLEDTSCLAVSSDGRYLATGNEAGQIFLWQIPAGTLCASVWAHRDAVRFLAFSPGGELASAGLDRMWRIWRTPDMVSLGSHPTSGAPGLLAFHPDGTALAGDAGAGELRIWRRGDAGWELPPLA